LRSAPVSPKLRFPSQVILSEVSAVNTTYSAKMSPAVDAVPFGGPTATLVIAIPVFKH
jgi:hypothetical protein